MVKLDITLNKRINKLIPLVQKYFTEVDQIEAIEILQAYTNYEHDTLKEIEEQIAFHYKKVKKGLINSIQ